MNKNSPTSIDIRNIKNNKHFKNKKSMFQESKSETFEKFKKIIFDNCYYTSEEETNYIFVIGDKKYLLENQEDLEEIKKLNMNNKTDYRCLEIRDKIIDEQFENRKQIYENEQTNQQQQKINVLNSEKQQLQQNSEDQIKEEISKEDLKQIYSTQCKQFFSQNKYLTCPCSAGNKQEKCLFCNNQKQIQYQQYQQELDQALENFLIDNLSKLELFIKDKLKFDQSGTNSWKTFHNELMNFENVKSFNFICIQCKCGFSKQGVVYVKQSKFPQSPVCMNCYENLNKEDQLKYLCQPTQYQNIQKKSSQGN